MTNSFLKKFKEQKPYPQESVSKKMLFILKSSGIYSDTSNSKVLVLKYQYFVMNNDNIDNTTFYFHKGLWVLNLYFANRWQTKIVCIFQQIKLFANKRMQIMQTISRNI